MKWPSLSSINFSSILKKLSLSGVPKVKSLLTLILALLPAIFLIWVWWWGPDFAFRDDYPFKPISARWLTTVIIFLIIISWVGFSAWRRMRELEKLNLDVELSVVDPVRKDVEFQNRYLDYWLSQLIRHLGGTTRSIYRRPWYFIIGAEGSGKKMLLNSTINTLDIAPLNNIVTEDNLELYLECPLADNAILIVPNGNLISQPTLSGEKPQLYHRLWEGLLSWMASNRTRQPLNGIILTIDTLKLMTDDKDSLNKYLSDIHLRLQEIRIAFNSRPPLYIVLTKLDLIQGFDAMFQSLDIQQRDAILGVTFAIDSHNDWQNTLSEYWEQWITQLNSTIPEMMLNRVDESQRSELFSFVRQMAGLKNRVTDLLRQLAGSDENDAPMIRGVYLTSSTQVGQIDDIFTQSAAAQYHLPPEPTTTWPLGETHTYFTGELFQNVLFAEPNLAAENKFWLKHHRNRLMLATTASVIGLAALWSGWLYYYDKNYQAGENVLTEVNAFLSTKVDDRIDNNGNLQLPILNPLRDATLAYGNYHDKNGLLTDMGLYQGDKVGPYVEDTYLQRLVERFLPAVMAGLLVELNQAPPESEEKLAILRIMRMLEDKSGRNNAMVEDYMQKRWSKEFTGQREIQTQLMSHLNYALEHTDWHGQRDAGSATAIKVYAPFATTIAQSQKELSQLSLYQRVYQTLRLKAFNELPSPLNLRHQIGPSFNTVFVSLDDEKLDIPQFLTRSGLTNYFIRQNEQLVELTLLDSWVLNISHNVKYSDSDRKEIQRQISEQYQGDYAAHWHGAMSNLDIREFESIQDEINALEQIISGEQPLRRALQVLKDNTALPAIDSSLPAKEQQALMAESPYKLLSRINREFSNQTEILTSNEGENLQNVNQKLNELHRYLLSIQNAPVPGKAALKAVSLRLDENNNDAIFEIAQMAKTLPDPMNRWVGELADQAWKVVQKEAIRYLEVEWNETVVKQYSTYIAGRYPFDPNSKQDVPLSEFERFFKPNGTFDAFYQQNLRPFIENNLTEDEDGQSLIRPDVMAQIEIANRIRDTFFTSQGNLETQFAIEPISLSGNKRRSILNLDGQLLDYAHGRSNTVHMVWPNSMRTGVESKLTLVPDVSGKSPRAIMFNGPWAQIRLINSGKLTNVNQNKFEVRFNIDGGEITYRIYIDEADNPFFGGLFTRFNLPDTLY